MKRSENVSSVCLCRLEHEPENEDVDGLEEQLREVRNCPVTNFLVIY